MKVNSPAVLITGAARRVGASIARRLHGAGCNLILHYRSSAAEAEQLAQELNSVRPASVTTVAGDLADLNDCQQMAAQASQHFGRLDALVNNASEFFATPIGSIDEESWQRLIGSNLKGPLFLAQALAPHLSSAPAGGAIVNITDIHAERPLAGYPLYCAAKAGLLGLTKALAIELAPQVRVNAVAPGAISWPEQGSDFPPQMRQEIINHALLKRHGDPNDIALTVEFLLLHAPYITGQVINVDGGRTAHL